MSAIPGLGRLRQQDLEFKANLGCIARPYLQKQTYCKYKIFYQQTESEA
jgi:hypothetical protein